jgi:hypothetical protein
MNQESNRFSGFHTATKTAEAVGDWLRLLITPLKWGVNENSGANENSRLKYAG